MWSFDENLFNKVTAPSMSEFVVKFVLADNSNEDAIQEAAKVCVDSVAET